MESKRPRKSSTATPDIQIVICTAFSDYSVDQMIDKIGWTERGKGSKFLDLVKAWQGGRPVPGWIHVNPASLEGEIMGPPDRNEIDARFDENLIIEYYSR